MSIGAAIQVAVTFVWLGMLLAISFLETPLKFRAPDVTLRIGLGIGRLVFRALNSVEVGLALVIVVSMAFGAAPVEIVVCFSVVFVALFFQLIAVRPRLTRRSNQVLAGKDVPRCLHCLGGGQGDCLGCGGDTATEQLRDG